MEGVGKLDDSLITPDKTAEDGKADEGLLGKKPRKVRATFKESNLLSKDGLWLLYKECQRLPLSRKEENVVSRSAYLLLRCIERKR